MRYLQKISRVKSVFVCATICIQVLSNASPISGSAADLEQLIIFVQPDASDVGTTFQNQQLPQIKKMAHKMGIEVYIVDPRKGVPPEVTITPLIVYQNFRGRSIYQGRTTTLGRIRNFIRTARFVPQGKALYPRENIPLWSFGKAQIWAPLKISAVKGTVPNDHNHTRFVEEAYKAIEEGFQSFQIRDKVEIDRADRGFYMDFYPWLSEDGTLFLSLALFSQFHCKKPVFETKDKPLVGPWKDRSKLFTDAAIIMEDAIHKCIKDSEVGDGFDFVSSDVPIASWSDLGFILPSPLKKEGRVLPIDMKIPRTWIVADPNPDDPPMIQFRFPAPLDNYTGEVAKVRGEIHLTGNLKEATGFIEADPRSVTMGETQLDDTIQGSLFLSTKKYPVSQFVVGSASTDGQPLRYGRLSPVSINGTFKLRGISLSLNPKIEVEPILGEKGKPLLLVKGAFRIDLRDFEIEGADGPEPAKFTLDFDLSFTMRPKALK